MNKSYYSIGLMSGTSADGVDASVIKSNGKDDYNLISDNYYKYTKKVSNNIHNLTAKIKKPIDLKKYNKQLKKLEKEITLFHANVVNKIVKKTKHKIDLIGFHGQTVYHDGSKKISKQLGNGKLLSKLIKKKVVYDFRKNDLKNGGQGAPLTPIFHELISKKYKFMSPNIFVNIGGITNITFLGKTFNRNRKVKKNWYAKDLCLGNCLIDQWIRKKSKKNFDKNGKIAQLGNINKLKLKKALKDFNIKKKKSLDIKDFDLSFVDGLSLKDGAATLTEYTASVFVHCLLSHTVNNIKIILCGGGRKNKFLIKKIVKKIPYPVILIDDYGINGDFIESQAFAYLAIRSYLKLPISFPVTTGCRKPSTGGKIVKNY